MKVVITGLGAISPVGNSVAESWDSLVNGRSGIGPLTFFNPREYGMDLGIAGEVRNLDPTAFMDRKEARRQDRFSVLALGAALEALEQSGLTVEGELCYQVGTIVASGVGGITTIEEQSRIVRERGARRVSPFTVPMLMMNGAAAIIAMKSHAMGASFATASACASSADALGVALEMIRSGRLKAAIAGGSDAALVPVAIAGFERAQALCTDSNDDPERASRPFDATRSGFVPAEGAAIMVLEEEQFARERGAPILAEFAGYGAASDAYHITAPEPSGRGGVRAVSAAIKDAAAAPEDVAYINAHGTSTPQNDKVESRIVHDVFGSRARDVPVSSTKSMTGHLGGAAGVFEALACVQALRTGWAAPTINYRTPDPECDIDCIPNEARRIRAGGVALSNSFGFGGHSSCLAFRGAG